MDKGSSIGNAELMEEPSLNLVQALKLRTVGKEQGSIGAFQVAPDVRLELGNHSRHAVEMPESQHGTDLRAYFAKDLLDTWNHCHLAVNQGPEQTKIWPLTQRGMQKME